MVEDKRSKIMNTSPWKIKKRTLVVGLIVWLALLAAVGHFFLHSSLCARLSQQQHPVNIDFRSTVVGRTAALPRVYCALPFKWRDNEPERGEQLTQMKFILKHWASRCDGVGFFIISKDPNVITEVSTIRISLLATPPRIL